MIAAANFYVPMIAAASLYVPMIAAASFYVPMIAAASRIKTCSKAKNGQGMRLAAARNMV